MSFASAFTHQVDKTPLICGVRSRDSSSCLLQIGLEFREDIQVGMIQNPPKALRKQFNAKKLPHLVLMFPQVTALHSFACTMHLLFAAMFHFSTSSCLLCAYYNVEFIWSLVSSMIACIPQEKKSKDSKAPEGAVEYGSMTCPHNHTCVSHMLACWSLRSFNISKNCQEPCSDARTFAHLRTPYRRFGIAVFEPSMFGQFSANGISAWMKMVGPLVRARLYVSCFTLLTPSLPYCAAPPATEARESKESPGRDARGAYQGSLAVNSTDWVG